MTPDIKQWLSGGKRHAFYPQSVEKATELSWHAAGVYPDDLINSARPGESATVRAYRKKIYVPMTTPTFDKVVNALLKIRKAADFTYQYDVTAVPRRITDGETLQDYCTTGFPKFTSLDNWYWSVAFRRALTDANAVTLVFPVNGMDGGLEPTEYVRPYCMVFPSPQVLDYVEEQYYFLKSDEVSHFTEGKRTVTGDVYYYADTEGVYRFRQRSARGEYDVQEYIHNIGRPPVVRMHGVIDKDNGESSLSQSRLSPMLPNLNNFIREFSDHQAEIIQHVHSQFWYFASMECQKCKGAGLIHKKNSEPVPCGDCGGQGRMAMNPFEAIRVKPSSNPGDPAPPTPPAGYLSKPIDIAQLQASRLEQMKYNALAAINFEHLAQVPLATSGTSKAWDRQGANDFTYAVAEDCVRMLDELHYFVNEYRYAVIVPDREEREAMLPRINVPQKFDISTEAEAVQDLARMKEAKFSGQIIAASEVEFVSRKFITDQPLRDKVAAIFELDPLCGKAEDDIIMQASQGWIDRETAIIHSNIREFIERAVEENADFLSLPLTDKKGKLMEYARAMTAATSQRAQVIRNINDREGSQGAA